MDFGAPGPYPAYLRKHSLERAYGRSLNIHEGTRRIRGIKLAGNLLNQSKPKTGANEGACPNQGNAGICRRALPRSGGFCLE